MLTSRHALGLAWAMLSESSGTFQNTDVHGLSLSRTWALGFCVWKIIHMTLMPEFYSMSSLVSRLVVELLNEDLIPSIFVLAVP